MSDSPPSRLSRAGHFATTHWSLVQTLGATDPARAREALEELCRTYWYPLYAYVRRSGRSSHDAQDLVQGFFEACLEGRFLESADPARGRFRSFLLVALKRHLANAWDRERAAKRGGGIPPLALDALTAEERYATEPADGATADRLYDRRWALTLLDRVLGRLQAEHASAGKAEAFEQLREYLAGDGRGTPYAELAARLGQSEGALKVAIHRLRKRYRALLEDEIARTVENPAQVEDERRHLLAALAGGSP